MLSPDIVMEAEWYKNQLFLRHDTCRLGPGPSLHSNLVLQTIHWGSCTITEKVPTRAFSSLKALTQNPVPYDNCIETEFYIYLPWGQCPFSIVS